MAPGGMMSIALPPAEVRELLRQFGEQQIDISAVNGPRSVVVAGEPRHRAPASCMHAVRSTRSAHE